MLDRLKTSLRKVPFGGTAAVVVGLVEGVAGEAVKKLPLPRHEAAKPAPQPAPTDAAEEARDDS